MLLRSRPTEYSLADVPDEDKAIIRDQITEIRDHLGECRVDLLDL